MTDDYQHAAQGQRLARDPRTRAVFHNDDAPRPGGSLRVTSDV